MATITFDPPATREQAFRFGAFMPDATIWLHTIPDWATTTVISDAIPCDLTIDPTKPETWLRAVYEAGKRDQLNESNRDFLRDTVARADSKITEIERMAGTTQQPAPFDAKVRCKVCGELGEFDTMGTPLNDGYVVSFVHKKCNRPQQPPMTSTLNWNSRVRITLTGAGRAIYDRHWMEVMGDREERPVAPQDGVIEMELWKAANLFGEHLYMGNTKPPMLMDMVLLSSP